MTGAFSVVPIDVMVEGGWDWSSTQPNWRAQRYGQMSLFDPFPAYRHDLAVIAETAATIAEICPPRWDVAIYAPDREEIGRTNGFSDMWGERDPVDERFKRFQGMIFMSGKRIPIHPAMTRYLVAHEYGHNVQWMLNHARSGPNDPQSDKILTGYAEMRGLPTPIHYGSGGRWHDSCAEVFADDFRTVVLEIETEFWPHPGVERPGNAVIDWWAQALDHLKAPALVTA